MAGDELGLPSLEAVTTPYYLFLETLTMDLDPTNPDHRPPYVEFITRSVEDKGRGMTEYGTWHVRDLIIAKITRPGQKDTVERVAEEWVADLRRQAADGRVPMSWARGFAERLAAYKDGQELPPDGIPIKGWQLLTPAQQETVIRAGIKTVEDLAAANAEAVGKIGMGAVTWKQAAVAWLAQGKDKGAVAAQVADLQRDNEVLQAALTEAQSQLKALAAEIAGLRPSPGPSQATL